MRATLAGPAVLAVLTAASALSPIAIAEIAAPAAAPVRLQPHRAVYDISLDETGPAMSIGSITGRVVYELMGSACEGYAQNMRFVTETASTEGQASTTDLRTSSWEDALARRMRFSSSTYQQRPVGRADAGDSDEIGCKGGRRTQKGSDCQDLRNRARLSSVGQHRDGEAGPQNGADRGAGIFPHRSLGRHHQAG